MKQFWVSAIIQDPDDKRAWCCAMNDSVSSIEEAKETIERARKNFTVLSAWVDVFDESNVKQTVLHECYVDAFGKVEKVEEN